jgi:hypothetical protein
MNKAYLVYAAAILLTTAYGAYQGWTFASVDEVRGIPASVRDNPGSYRSVYSGYHHYTGGK